MTMSANADQNEPAELDRDAWFSDTLLRVTVGGFLIPHGVFKFVGYAKEVEVFGQVFGLNPAPAWVIGVAIAQIVCGLLIVFNRLVVPALALTILMLAGTIVFANGGNGWFWHFKGIEYSVFWMIAAAIVVIKQWAKGSKT
jgi:uncharacterized membrane protein YphA (DoxX/SURF4 family)